MWRTLKDREEFRFRQWARKNYVPGSQISELWHPVVRAECALMNTEAGNATS
jgi:hypothetical protein